MSRTRSKVFLVAGIVTVFYVFVTLYSFLLSPRSSTAMVATNTPKVQPFTAEDSMRNYVNRVSPEVQLDEVGCDTRVGQDGFVACRATGVDRVDGKENVIIAMCKNLASPTDICE